MPTPPLSDRDALEAFTASQEHGGDTAAAKALGMSRCTLQHRRNVAIQRGLHLDPGIQEAMRSTGLSAGSATHGWRRVKDPETGSFNSVFWKAPPVDVGALTEAMRAAFEGLPASRPVPRPAGFSENICSYLVIADHHLAMHSWGKQTGEDYNLKIGVNRLRECAASLVASTPASAECVLLNLGDFYHADDDRNETPANRHKLDVDGRYYKVVEAGVAVTVECIESAKLKHDRVRYRALRGNHDPHAHVALTIALRHHYRDDDRVTIEGAETDFFVHEWGRNMIAAHHGDKAKPDRLVMHMADHWPEIWGRTHWRYIWTGHIHHDSAKDIGGAKWESFRTLAPKDAYAAGHAYSSRQSMQAITMDREHGEVMRNVVNIIPPRFR